MLISREHASECYKVADVFGPVTNSRVESPVLWNLNRANVVSKMKLTKYAVEVVNLVFFFR